MTNAKVVAQQLPAIIPAGKVTDEDGRQLPCNNETYFNFNPAASTAWVHVTQTRDGLPVDVSVRISAYHDGEIHIDVKSGDDEKPTIVVYGDAEANKVDQTFNLKVALKMLTRPTGFLKAIEKLFKGIDNEGVTG